MGEAGINRTICDDDPVVRTGRKKADFQRAETVKQDRHTQLEEIAAEWEQKQKQEQLQEQEKLRNLEKMMMIILPFLSANQIKQNEQITAVKTETGLVDETSQFLIRPVSFSDFLSSCSGQSSAFGMTENFSVSKSRQHFVQSLLQNSSSQASASSVRRDTSSTSC